MVRAAGLAACILLGGGCQQDAFFCDTQEDCTSEDGGGACESTGYCSFPDPECDTGRRYGDLAPSGLAGTCVPQMGETDGPSSIGSTSSTSAPDPTLAETTSSSTSGTTGTTGTTGSSSESSTSAASGESSSTGEPPLCCDASCSTCGESCASEVLDSTDAGEALSIAVVGTTLIWTTGFTREVFTIDLTTGVSTLLTTADEVLTNIAADDEYIYYLSFADGFVSRISLTSGAESIIANANDGGADAFEAGYGQIVLDDTDVYFALGNPLEEAQGGAFRAPKVPVPDVLPERIGTLERPLGIGIDATSIYIADRTEDALFRFDKADPGLVGTEMLALTNPGHVYVTDADVYATGDGQLMRVPKDGTAASLLVDTNGEIRGITGDEAHVYITDIQSDSVTRVSLFDTEPPLQIATSPSAWGIVTDCTHVYWCENGTRSVLSQPK